MGTEEATEKSPGCDFVTVDIKIHFEHKNLPIFVRFEAMILLGHSVYLNTEHYFVSFGHFLAKNDQKVMS